jgi:imidazolonepropionase
MNLLIYNIKGLVQAENHPRKKVSGADMAKLPLIPDAWVLIKDQKIASFGPMHTLPAIEDVEKIDATGRFVLPSYVDPHTHMVFATTREKEFELRIKGATYEEIAEAGGGILNSAQKLGETSEEALFESAKKRLDEVIQSGTGAIEIKSGYGLTVESELKMLRVIKALKEISPIPIRATFLGAHAVPARLKNSREKYVDEIINQMIPKIKEEKLADYIDVFCDRGFFTPAETDAILKAGIASGLKPRIHANELDYSGGIQVGVANKALSVDHLEYSGDAEIIELMNSDTMPVLLPSTAFFLKLPYPPARKMIERGLPVALASDYNPGSSPSGNMNFVISLACIYLGMSPEEAINAATINSAYSLELSDSLGSISPGKTANLFITEPMSSYAVIPYSFGKSRVETVILRGVRQSSQQSTVNSQQ